uniref:Polymerase PB2 n=1 Tax=Cryptocercus meridianus orthomyxovirus 2 TaxID=3133493 RepID=A0AAT9JA19_9ORTO
MDSTSKEVLLSLCKKIKEANRGSIDILRTQPVCNLKIVQRRAKNIKDPNPLSSMMSTISTKYPLSVDIERASKVGLPREFLYLKDAHQHGRVLCKLEAVDWYLNNSKAPTNDIKKAIDILFETKRNQVKFYYSFDWSRARISHGETYIQRSLINMQESSIKIPRNQKVEYIMACMMPQYILDYGQLNKDLLDDLKKIRDLNLLSKMTIQSQLRILMNTLDEKPRFVPCLVNASVEVNRIRHAFATNRYKIHVENISSRGRSSNKELLTKLGQSLWLIIEKGESLPKIHSYVRDASHEGRSIISCIENEPNLEGMFINYLMVFMGKSIIASSTIGNFTFTPINGKTVTHRMKGKNGVFFNTYQGIEMIQFKGRYVRGIFKHDGDIIMGINMTKSDAMGVKDAIMAIAEYCKIWFAKAQGKTLRILKRNVREMYNKEPWKLINLDRISWRKVTRQENIGVLRFSEEVDQRQPPKVYGKISKGNIILENGNILIIEKPFKAPMLPESLEIQGSAFNDYLPPRIRFSRKIEYYVHNHMRLRKCILDGIFTWENDSISLGIPSLIRRKVALTAQHHLNLAINLDIDIHILSFFYCFANTNPGFINTEETITDFIWFSNYKMDFLMQTGGFRITDGEVMIFNSKLRSFEKEEMKALTPCLLPGYKFLIDPNENVEFKSPNYLIRMEKKIKQGSQFNISLYGKTFLVVRDKTANAALLKTISRNMQSIKSSVIFEQMLSFSNSLKRRADTEFDDGPSTSKRVRVYEEEEVDALGFGSEDECDDVDFD